MTEPRLSKAAFAEVMGVDRSQPTRWAQKGMPVHEDGTVEPVAAATWVRQNVADYARRDRSRGAVEQRGATLTQAQHSYDNGVRVAVSMTAHDMVGIAAEAAVSIGLTMGQTYGLVRQMQGRGGARRDWLLKLMQVPLGERPAGEPLGMFRVPWKGLAVHLDVPMDLAAWQAEADELAGPDPDPEGTLELNEP